MIWIITNLRYDSFTCENKLCRRCSRRLWVTRLIWLCDMTHSHAQMHIDDYSILSVFNCVWVTSLRTCKMTHSHHMTHSHARIHSDDDDILGVFDYVCVCVPAPHVAPLLESVLPSSHFILEAARWVLQWVAVSCSVLQCVALCCCVLQCVAVCCSVLHCVAMCCNLLQCVLLSLYFTIGAARCVVVCCSVLQCVVYCNVLQCAAVSCSVL